MASLNRAPGFVAARFQLGLLQLTNGRPHVAMATWESLLVDEAAGYFRCFAQAFVSILQGDKAAAE